MGESSAVIKAKPSIVATNLHWPNSIKGVSLRVKFATLMGHLFLPGHNIFLRLMQAVFYALRDHLYVPGWPTFIAMCIAL